MDHISAIIPAAGFSSRMGKYKPLMPLGSHNTVEHAVRCFKQAGITDIKVITGFNAAKVSEVVSLLGIDIIYNPDFAQGMYTSIQAGVGALESITRAFFVLPADIPLVSHTTIRKILDCWDSDRYGVVYPVFEGKRGHPPLVSMKYRDEIIRGGKPDGLKGILALHEDDAYNLDVADEAVLLDMDTPEDYRRNLSYACGDRIPSIDQCMRILIESGADEEIKKHCRAVARVAADLAEKLNRAGAGLDENLLLAGAMLHDIARQKPNHALKGAELLEEYGYPLVADIVKTHMDIDVLEDQPLTEAEVVYYADKTVKSDTFVTVNERFKNKLQIYKDDPRAEKNILKRMRQAELIELKINKALGYSVEKIV